jgi:Na+/H+-translocating membrane pyrophosphatase
MVLGISVLALLFASHSVGRARRARAGIPEMQTISNAVRKGARAFRARRNETVGKPAIAVALLVFVIYGFNTVIYSKNR